MEIVDVLVVGSGNAGLSAALAAREAGASVTVVDSAPEAWAGGNSYFTAGAFRATYDSIHDIRDLLALTDEHADRIELPAYGVEAFLADMARVTQRRTDPVLARLLADESTDALRWLHGLGVRFELLYARQSFEIDDRIRFWGNLTIGSAGGGVGLIEAELAAAERSGIEVRFDTAVVNLLVENRTVVGVEVAAPTGRHELRARSVVLASGGFEADVRRRAMFLGPGWDLAKVRGTPYNTGDPLMLAIEAGAQAYGHWSGCHAIAWDASAPGFGDRSVTNRFSRQGYPYGIVVNANGDRFVDEGADFRNYTYAKYGAEVLRQPNAVAYQIFDQTALPYLSSLDYGVASESRFEASTVRELADQIGVNAGRLTDTVAAFNASIQPAPFNPTIKDGKGTRGIQPPKSNWALPLENGPFVAFAVTCGITFTFGGLRISPHGAVLRPDESPLNGLFACGEIVGGLFYHNYPGGTGLTSGTVFGRRAGAGAARHAASAAQPAGKELIPS